LLKAGATILSAPRGRWLETEVVMPKGDFGEPASQLVYTVVEAAQALRLSRSKTYELLRNGRLRSVRIGGRRLVRRADLERFVKELGEGEE